MAGIRITLKETGQQSIARLWVYNPNEPDFLIHFRRPEDYYGEFGFDWMRDDYSTICNNYEELKKEYYDCEKNEKVELLKDKEYFVPWFSMLPKQKDVKLALKLENIKRELSEKDIIKIPTTESISFEPNEIKLKNIQKKEKEGKEFLVTVTCSKPLTKDICIPVLNKDNKEVGKLNVAKNDVEYHLPVTVVNVLGNNLQTDNINTLDIQSFFNLNSFQQAFIKTNVRGDNLRIDLDSLLEEEALSMTIDENNVENIVANGKTLDTLSYLFSKLNNTSDIGVNLFILKLDRWHFVKYEANKNDKYGNYDVYEVIDINKDDKVFKGYKYVCGYNDDRVIDNSRGNYFAVARGMVGESRVIPTRQNSCIVYNGYDKEMAIVHEISHLLGLPENFLTALSEDYYNKLKRRQNLTEIQEQYIKDYESMSKYNYFFFDRAYTDNFMDYYEPLSYSKSPIKKSFNHWQWGIMQYEINNYIKK
jgi:hypothetical protein